MPGLRSIQPHQSDDGIYPAAGKVTAEPGGELLEVPDVLPAAEDVAAVADAGVAVADLTESGTGEPTETEEEDDSESEAEDQGLGASFRARRIRIGNLTSRSLRRLLWLAVAQIALVAILMALQKVPQREVNSSVPGAAGGTFAVPLAVFVVVIVSLAAGYWFGLAGALRIRPALGVPVAALATWALADVPISSLRLGGTSIDTLTSDTGLRWAQLGVLAVFWLWLGGSTLAKQRAQRKKPAEAPDPAGQPWHPPTFKGSLACVLAYYALELAIWARYAGAGQAAVGTGSLLQDLGVQAILLPTFLILVVLLGSTDLLSWGEITVRSAVVRVTRNERFTWLMICTPLAAVAMIGNVIRLDGSAVLPELVVVGIPGALVALLVRLAPPFGAWSGAIRSRAVITGAVVTFLYLIILANITSAIRSAIGWSFELDDRLYSLVSIPVALVALTAGLFVLAHPKIGEPEQRGRGLLLVILGALLTVAGLPAFLAAAHWPAAFPAHHFSLLSGLQLVAALGALGWLINLALRKRTKPAGPQLANVFALLAGLQIIRWLLDLLEVINKSGSDSDYLLAALFFLTVFWGFATSGDGLTGAKANSAAYPRDGRILLTVGYVLVSNAILLYLGALRAPGTGKMPASFLTADPATVLGLGALGSALVILAFVAKTTSLPTKEAAPAERAEVAGKASPPRADHAVAPARVRSYRAAQIGIVGTGAIATGVALLILGSSLPRLTRANAALLTAPYAAPVPGPGCDAGGALWSVTPGEPITTRCEAASLHVEIGPGPNIEGDVKFLPPNGFASQNYSISVDIAFSHGFDGCAGIFTRASAAGRYLTVVCGDGSVDIERLGAHGSSLIFLKFVGRAPGYTISAVSQGSRQSVSIDGVKVGTVANSSFAETLYLGLGVVSGSSRAESVSFSHFVFTPLPAPRRA